MSDERCGHNARHDDDNYDRVDIAAGLSILYYVEVTTGDLNYRKKLRLVVSSSG